MIDQVILPDILSPQLIALDVNCRATQYIRPGDDRRLQETATGFQNLWLY